MNTRTTNTTDAEIMLRQARRIQELAGEIVGLTAGLKALREENNRQDLIIEELRAKLAPPPAPTTAPQTDLDTYDAHMSIAEVGVMQNKINVLVEACKALLTAFDCSMYQDQFEIGSEEDKAIMLGRDAIAKAESK